MIFLCLHFTDVLMLQTAEENLNSTSILLHIKWTHKQAILLLLLLAGALSLQLLNLMYTFYAWSLKNTTIFKELYCVALKVSKYKVSTRAATCIFYLYT